MVMQAEVRRDVGVRRDESSREVEPRRQTRLQHTRLQLSPNDTYNTNCRPTTLIYRSVTRAALTYHSVTRVALIIAQQHVTLQTQNM